MRTRWKTINVLDVSCPTCGVGPGWPCNRGTADPVAYTSSTVWLTDERPSHGLRLSAALSALEKKRPVGKDLAEAMTKARIKGVLF